MRGIKGQSDPPCSLHRSHSRNILQATAESRVQAGARRERSGEEWGGIKGENKILQEEGLQIHQLEARHSSPSSSP